MSKTEELRLAMLAADDAAQAVFSRLETAREAGAEDLPFAEYEAAEAAYEAARDAYQEHRLVKLPSGQMIRLYAGSMGTKAAGGEK